MAGISKRIRVSWVSSNYGIMKTATDIITTLPAVLYPNDTTATVGLKGNTAQNGTPTPQSPVMPNGTGERTGNLMSFPDIAETTKNGVTYYVSGNSLYINGTSTTAFGIAIRNAFTLKAGTYTNQMYGFTGRRIYYSFNNVSATMCASDVNLFKTFTISEDTTYASALVWINNGVTFNNEKIDFALFESEEPKDYEPYGYKLDISSASTTTPVYLGEVQTTRKIKKLVLTGAETVAGSAVTGGWIITNLSDSINNTTGMQTSYCSHYAAKNNGAMSSLSQGEMCISTQVNNRINFVTTFATAEDFKSYLAQQYAAGTPVTVWYVLATSETAVVNEPLMKIGDYADEVSGISIPVTAGGDTISVDTTLQPSEMSATYKGWHPVQSVHEKSRNLLDYTTVESTSYATATPILGGITISGQYYVQFTTANFTVGRSYTMSWTAKTISGTVKIMWRYRYSDNTYSPMPSSGETLRPEKEVSALLLYVNGSSTESGVAEITNIMLNEGSTALPYEPYWK